jgi:uncharacterized cupredoxin-like copper-binding protein
MNTNRIFRFAAAPLFALVVVCAQAEEKTTTEKASEAWDATKKTTKEVARDAVDATKRAANRVEAAVMKADADARKVEVRVDDRGVRLPPTLRPGKTAFVVKNLGGKAHKFEVEGSGFEKSFWVAIPPNETKTMQVELKPGSYEAACRVKGHEKEAKVGLVVK